MATGGAPGSKDEDSRYTCTLCMESYQRRSPKILPCFHTFCLPCLSALEASVTTAAAEASRSEDETKDAKEDGGEDADGEGKGAGEEKESKAENVSVEGSARQGQGESGKIFLCPTCRAPVTIPEGGVVNLQTNFYLDHELNEGEASRPVLCGMCDEGHQQPATHTCRDCQSHMCHTCRRYHDKFIANHHVTRVSLGQPVTEKKEEEKKALCMVHRDQVLCFHCQQCHVSICLHCKFSSHERHDTVELSGAILQAKGEMTSLVTSAQQQIHIMQSSLRSVNRKERQLARYSQETTQKVHARFDQLLTWGQQSRDRLLDAVSRKEDEDKSHLQAEKSALTSAIDRLNCLVSRASAQSSRNDPDVVVLRNELKAALLSEDKLDHHQQQAENEDTAWSWRYVHTNTSGLQVDDVQAFMGRLVNGRADDDDVIRQVSLQDLADKLDRLMSDTTSMLSAMMEKDADLERKIKLLSEETKMGELALQTLQDEVADLKKSTVDLQRDVTSLQKSEADTKQTMESLKEKTEYAVTDLTKSRDDLQKTVTSHQKSETDTKQVVKSLKEKTDLADKLDRFVSDTTSMLSTVTEKDADLERKIESLSEKTKKGELALQTLQDAVTDLKKSRDDQQRNVTSLQKSETDTMKTVESLKEKTEDAVSDLKKSRDDLQKTVTSLQKSETDTQQAVESLKEKTGKAVSFLATGCNERKTEVDHPVVFNELHHNQGGGFDITTGKFTAAIPGTYIFSATVGSINGEVVSWLCVNDVGYCSIRASYFSIGACSVPVRLKAGDSVWMEAQSSSCDYYDYETTFTGVLVQAGMWKEKPE